MSKKSLLAIGMLLLSASAAFAQSPGAGGPAGLGAPLTAPETEKNTAIEAPTSLGTLPPRGATNDFAIPPASSFPGTGQPNASGAWVRPVAATSSCMFDAAGCVPYEHWSDNLSIYSGIDGAKEPADVGINANFGYRFAVNLGLPLIEEAGIGIQVGSALNYSRTAVRVLRFVDGTVEHTQSFSTIGLFQRTDGGLSWGIGYDYRWDEYYDRFTTSQWRGQVGYDLNDNDQIGVWGTLHQGSARAELAGLPLSLTPLNQINFYWRHIWPNEAVTRAWVGFTEDHGRFNFLIPGEPPVRHPLCFGADLLIPLNDSLAIFGEAQFITPNDSGTVCATLGVAWYPGAAKRAARNRFAPLLNVANNATMPLDLRARFEVFALAFGAQ